MHGIRLDKINFLSGQIGIRLDRINYIYDRTSYHCVNEVNKINIQEAIKQDLQDIVSLVYSACLHDAHEQQPVTLSREILLLHVPVIQLYITLWISVCKLLIAWAMVNKKSSCASKFSITKHYSLSIVLCYVYLSIFTFVKIYPWLSNVTTTHSLAWAVACHRAP